MNAKMQKNPLHKYSLDFIFWIAVFLFEGSVEFLLNKEFYTQTNFLKVIRFNFFPELLLTAFVKIPLCYAIVFHIFKKRKSLSIKILVPTISYILMGILLHRIIIMTWNNNFSLSAGFGQEDILFDRYLIYAAFLDNLFVLGLFVALKYYHLQFEWVEREQSLVKQKLEYELIFLKGQINPHFLFNTLNNLFSIAQQNENHELADGISKLSGMMRYMIYESSATFVPLVKEIEYINYFIGLNKLRYHESEVTVKFDYSEHLSSVNIAPMILIPFVENAFKHGVAIAKRSAINLSLKVNNNHILFSCINDVHRDATKIENEAGGIGLENVRRRLDLIYPDMHDLVIVEDENCFSCSLKITIK